MNISTDRQALLSPFRRGNLDLRTRLVLPPMASGTADDRGRVTDATLAHYSRIVGPAHGLALVEYTYVHPWGRSEPRQLGLFGEEHVAGLQRLAALLASRGARPGIQLVHGGGKADPELIGRTPLGASALPIPAVKGELPAPQPMGPEHIAELRQAFVSAALRAERAGFEVIELHAAHGYFLNQWLSGLTNQRSDEHGGTLLARAGLLVDLVRDLRAALSATTAISLRFAGQDRLPGGLTLADTAIVGRAVRDAGADLLDVSSGLGGWRRGRDQRGEGYLVEDAAILRRKVGLPVVGVGGIETLDYCARALERVDLLAVGRAILSNPAWPQQPCA